MSLFVTSNKKGINGSNILWKKRGYFISFELNIENMR